MKDFSSLFFSSLIILSFLTTTANTLSIPPNLERRKSPGRGGGGCDTTVAYRQYTSNWKSKSKVHSCVKIGQCYPFSTPAGYVVNPTKQILEVYKNKDCTGLMVTHWRKGTIVMDGGCLVGESASECPTAASFQVVSKG